MSGRKVSDKLVVFGFDADDDTLTQMHQCLAVEDGARGVLCADNHKGYSMPIGGVVAYQDHVSMSAVGYDIGCGNLAVRTNVRTTDIGNVGLSELADAIYSQISFGLGRVNDDPVQDAQIISDIASCDLAVVKHLHRLAQNQLGTVGGGNHYVDLLQDEWDNLWVGIHFGSRGFGHTVATGFMNLAENKPFSERRKNEDMMAKPIVTRTAWPVTQDYLEAMDLAGRYAMTGRNVVAEKVLKILGAKETDRIHNHHNFAWRERHSGTDYWVHRKGATPAFNNQRGFVGGSMGDHCVILKGKESAASASALYSTVHGAGRVLSRNRAKKGTYGWKCPHDMCGRFYVQPKITPPKDMCCPEHGEELVKSYITPPIDYSTVRSNLALEGVYIRGGDADEAPGCYRKLLQVLLAHTETIEVEHILVPRVVVMAGKDTIDPYKD